MFGQRPFATTAPNIKKIDFSGKVIKISSYLRNFGDFLKNFYSYAVFLF